jgi:hypothetical protein
MEKQQKTQFKDATFYIGLGLIILSLGIYLLPNLEHLGNPSDLNFGIFILNYLISIIFFVLVWIREIPAFKISFFYQKTEYGFIYLILCLISAYSLKREITVFEQSTPWLQGLLILQGIVFLMVFFKHHFAGWVLFVFWGFMGISVSLFLYLSIYLIPWYFIGAAACFIFGISLYAYMFINELSKLLSYEN